MWSKDKRNGAYLAGRASVMAYPRKIVAKMSVEMKTIWHSTMPYLHGNTLDDSTAVMSYNGLMYRG